MESISQIAPRRQPAHEDLEPLLLLEQVRLIYDFLPFSQLVAVVNAVIFVAVQSLVISWSVLLAWLYTVCMVALIRIAGGVAFRRRDFAVRPWFTMRCRTGRRHTPGPVSARDR